MSDPPDEGLPVTEPFDAFWALVGKDKRWKRVLKIILQVILVSLPASIVYVALALTPLRFLSQKLDAQLPDWLKLFPISASSFPQYVYYGLAAWLTLILFTVFTYASKRVEVAKRILSQGVMRDLFIRHRTGPGKLLYQWFVRSYRTPLGNDAVVEFCEIAGIDVTRNVPTYEIAKHYKDGKKTATDYLCVINAHKRNSFLASTPDAFDYFARYDRKQNPRDRITRIFSVPLELRQQAGTTIPNWSSWSQIHREALFAALWVNKVAGVDTKLHLFCPGHTDNDFFEKADYVICFDPAESLAQKQKLVFLALPSNEKTCLKICGSPELYFVFEHEFYLRTTEGCDTARPNDMLTLFTRDTYAEILSTLDVDSKFATKVLDDLEAHVDTLNSAVKRLWAPRVARWKNIAQAT